MIFPQNAFQILCRTGGPLGWGTRQTLTPDTSFSFCYAEYWKTRPPGLRFNETIPRLLQGTVKQNQPLKTLPGFKLKNACLLCVGVDHCTCVAASRAEAAACSDERGFALVPSSGTPPEDARPAVAPTRQGRSRVPAAAWASPPSHATRRGGTRRLIPTSSRFLPVFRL